MGWGGCRAALLRLLAVSLATLRWAFKTQNGFGVFVYFGSLEGDGGLRRRSPLGPAENPATQSTLQLGGPDSQQQLESHNSQPQLKYARLKNIIINSPVIGEAGRKTIYDKFAKIFLVS
jgi:hypothetical protein